jgi:hypothetical protein
MFLMLCLYASRGFDGKDKVWNIMQTCLSFDDNGSLNFLGGLSLHPVLALLYSDLYRPS